MPHPTTAALMRDGMMRAQRTAQAHRHQARQSPCWRAAGIGSRRLALCGLYRRGRSSLQLTGSGRRGLDRGHVLPREQRARIVDLLCAPLAAPAVHVAHELGDTRQRGDGGRRVHECHADAALEEVVRRLRVLHGRAVSHLGLEHRQARREPVAEALLARDAQHLGRAVTVRRCQVRRDVVMRRAQAGQRVGLELLPELGRQRGTERARAAQRQAAGDTVASVGRHTASRHDGVHRFLGHLAVRRPLAARHVEHAVGVRPHHMVAHHVLRVVAAALGRRRRRQWADTTPGGEHILAADLNPQVVRQRVQNPCDVRLAGRGLGLGEALGVRRARDERALPRQQEQHAAVLGLGHQHAHGG
mmetsp:Transcript_24433/g.72450  ORF Transcript_24433/g.72450 Transcript_24433/m.72450 type:complete len:359 (-) Transcript_24433:1060-2136(-)